MIVPGLHSVTFRHLGIDAIAEQAAAARLRAVEWNGDVHVAPGDLAAAERARQISASLGLAVSGYGSYHWAGDDAASAFAPVLESAAALNAPIIRVWAGRKASAEASPDDRARVAEGLRAIADASAAHGIGIALEYHAGTLTDTAASARALLDELRGTGVRSHWQPPVGLGDDAALDGLRTVGDDLAAVHVFAWWPTHERLPLEHRAPLWRSALQWVQARPGDHPALLEFVAGDDPEVMRRDAATLLRLIEEAQLTEEVRR